MRSKVIEVDSIAEAAERILDELKEDPTQSIGSGDNVIYFDGWDGLGASAVLRDVAQRLTAMASPPAGLQFDQIIHVDCSKWESRRSLQRAVAEQLELPAPVMDMFDTQDEEDDFNGVTKDSRSEIPQVLRAMRQRTQDLSHRFLVIFHNGSTEEIDLGRFGFLLSGYYSTAKVLWTFQGRFRMYPRMKVDRALNKSSTSDVFLSAVTGKKRHPQLYWSCLVQQEADDLVAAARKSNAGHGLVTGDIIFQPQQQQVLQGDIVSSDDDDDGPWRAADALQREMLIDVEHWQHNLESLPSHLVRSEDSMACMPYWTSAPYEALLSPVRDMMFQQFNKLGVLKLSHCTFSSLSPPFHSSNNLRVLWLDHCKDQAIFMDDGAPEKIIEEDIRRLFQRLWVLDMCYSRCDRILSAPMIALMTQLRELNVVGAHDWDIGQLQLQQGCLPNIRKLRVTKSTVGCSENNLSLGMNKMELLDFSGNYTLQGGVAANLLSGIITSSNELETVIITDGCVGIHKFSFRGCAKLKNLLLSGLFEDLHILDLSDTAVKTLDLSAMTAPNLDELILDNCDKLCAILWPPQDKWKNDLKVHIDITQSPSTSRTAATGSSSSSWPMLLVHDHLRPPPKFNWYISVKDTRLLRSFEPLFGKYTYIDIRKVHWEISSPRCCPISGSKNEGIRNETREEPQVVQSNKRRQQQPQYNTSMYYANVANIIIEEQLIQEGEGNGNDAPTITRTRPCPAPYLPEGSTNCYVYTQDQQKKTKAAMDGGATATATIPWIIYNRTRVLHVHDSLYNTSIPGASEWVNLRWCRVERCPRLDFVFTAPQVGHVLMCEILETFWASQLPRARFMWDTSKLHLSEMSFELVKLLHLDFCPRLIHVFPFSSSVYENRLLPNRWLETIEIVWCGDLRAVFPLLDTNNTRRHQEQQQKPPGARITMMDFPNLKHIHLHELPKLESICGLGRMYAPKLECVKIRGCWSLRHLPAVDSNRSSNKVACDCEKEWWDMLEWDGLNGKHHPSLYSPIHSRYYKKKLLRGSVLI